MAMAIQGFAVIVIITLGFAPWGTSEVKIYVVPSPCWRAITGKNNGGEKVGLKREKWSPHLPLPSALGRWKGKDGKRAVSDSCLSPLPYSGAGRWDEKTWRSWAVTREQVLKISSARQALRRAG